MGALQRLRTTFTPGISPTLFGVQQGSQGQLGWAPNPTPAQPQPVASAWAAEGIGLSDLSQLGQGLVHTEAVPGS